MDVLRREREPNAQESPERYPQKPADFRDNTGEDARPAEDTAAIKAQRVAAERAARPTREMKDPLLVRIESALSNGLEKEYALLTKSQQDLLRKEGEELAVWLHEALMKKKVSSHEVLQRIEKWLLIIEAKDRAADWLLQEAYVRTRRMLRTVMHEEMGH